MKKHIVCVNVVHNCDKTARIALHKAPAVARIDMAIITVQRREVVSQHRCLLKLSPDHSRFSISNTNKLLHSSSQMKSFPTVQHCMALAAYIRGVAGEIVWTNPPPRTFESITPLFFVPEAARERLPFRPSFLEESTPNSPRAL